MTRSKDSHLPPDEGPEKLHFEVRRGAYRDSIVLLQLQVRLEELDGVVEAAAVMAAVENLELLEQQGMLPEGLGGVAAEDLVVVVRAASAALGSAALGEIDRLLERPQRTEDDERVPASLAEGFRRRPETRWVSISVPGRYARRVAEEALAHGRHVFLFSDNVPPDDEIALKERSASCGLLLLGPDCGTARLGGSGLGFSNRLEAGPVALVGASGTGLQTISSLLDGRGVGVGTMIGTGSHDLSRDVGATTTLQALDLLARDSAAEVLVVVSKPPAPEVARRVLAAARATGKPTVVCLLGQSFPVRRVGRLHFASGLGDAAALAAELALSAPEAEPEHPGEGGPGQGGLLRGLFAGGTLALEGLVTIRALLDEDRALHSNLEAPGVRSLDDPEQSQSHTILDLGDDAYTRGRAHPMIDQSARLRRLEREAAELEVSTIVLDVVLGDGAHPDPASELAPAIRRAQDARPADRPLSVIVIRVATRNDPQESARQRSELEAAGAWVVDEPAAAWSRVLDQIGDPAPPATRPAVPLEALEAPLRVVNVGLESFADSLAAQGAEVLHVRWQPPAGGNPQLMSILDKLKHG